MHEDFRAILTGDAGVSAMVGARVHWGGRPQGGALPALALSMVDSEPEITQDGFGPTTARVQVDALADDFAGARDLWRAAAAALSGYLGPASAVVFLGILPGGARELHENEPDFQIFRFSEDFTVTYSSKGP